MKRRICVVGPSLQMGGLERESCNMANAFARAGYETLFLAVFKHPPFLNLDLDVLFKEPLNETKSLSILPTILRIKRELQYFKPEAILAYNTFYGSIVLIAARGLKIPVFIRDGASPIYRWPLHVKTFFILTFKILSPAGVITQTRIAISYQRKFYKKNVRFKDIPNIIRPIKPVNITRENIILAVGRLNDHLKGFDLLIRAFALLNNKSWKLMIAGGGKENAKQLSDLAESLGVLERIMFLGKVNDIDSLYIRAGIFVLPSRSEGFPNALCEAMTFGMPCVSFDIISGPRELIHDSKNGILVEKENVQAMAKSIDYLIDNPDIRKKIGHEAQRIYELLNESVIVKQFLAFMLPNYKNYE